MKLSVGTAKKDYGEDTTAYSSERRTQECEDGAFLLEEDIGLNPLTERPPGPTLLYYVQSFKGDPWEPVTAFRCYARRDFLVQKLGLETILIVLGGPAQPTIPMERNGELDAPVSGH